MLKTIKETHFDFFLCALGGVTMEVVRGRYGCGVGTMGREGLRYEEKGGIGVI